MVSNPWSKGFGIGLLLGLALMLVMSAGLATIPQDIRAEYLSTNRMRSILSAGTAGWSLVSQGSSTQRPTWAPREQVIYASTAPSAAHTGATAAATLVMPASAEGTGATSVATWMLAGSVFEWDVLVGFTGDADGDETLTVTVEYGTVVVANSGAIAVDAAGEIHLRGQLKVKTGGATGTGVSSFESFSGAAVVSDGAAIGSTDFTAATPFEIKLDWGGTTDAADTASVLDATVTVNDFGT